MTHKRTPAAFDDADETMDGMLDNLQHASNYVAHIHDLMRPYLDGPVLEVGAGHGDLTTLLRDDHIVVATDLSERCLEMLRSRLSHDPRVSVVPLDLTKRPLKRELQAQAVNETEFGSAVLVNVLEHIEDDTAALRNLAEVVRPGGHIAVFVPAFELLYGRFDNLIRHFRRYRKASLSATVEAAGLRVADIRYVNLPGWFAWLLLIRLARGTPSNGRVVQAYDRFVIPGVRAMEKRWRPTFGQSLFCIAAVDRADDVADII